MKLQKWNFWVWVFAALIFLGCSQGGSTGVEFITHWGGSGSEPGKFNQPIGVALDSLGNVYVTDSGNNRIQKFTADGKFLAEWGRSGSGLGELDRPMLLAMSPDGLIYVPEYGNDRVQVFDTNGAPQFIWGTPLVPARHSLMLLQASISI